ncbi:Myb-like_DNA-binding domain-containing protein [Hexamita inflata]|uniref:Myb-like_DNA-binding domain-containing protein n=1 Tax=Hexamita inflata TaxID=28002 RepID=A0ABP1GYM1_9EUKA
MRNQPWSELEKQQLNELITQNTTNNRINWHKIASVLNNRTPVQCKLQYRNVLNKKREKVNVEWTEYQEVQLTVLTMMYGTKWNFIQQNYYQKMKPEQLQLKHHQINSMYVQYEEMCKNPDQYTVLNNKQIKILEYSLRRIDLIKKKLAFLAENKPGITTLDPLELQFYKMAITEEYVAQLLENEKTINKLLKQQKQ